MKKILIISVLAVICIFSTKNCQGAIVLNKEDTEKYLYATADYIMKKNPNPTYGSMGGEWAMLGLARFGTIEKSYIDKYEKNLSDVVKDKKGVLSEKKYTEYARVGIAYSAIGGNAKNCCGYNMLKPLGQFSDVKNQGPNGIIYTLIALDTKRYSVSKPDSDYDGVITSRENLIDAILKAQLDNGGFAFFGNNADADMTAMVIQALAPYYNKRDDVTKAVDAAIEKLSYMQKDNGGYNSGPLATCESTAQVLTALSEMRISVKDERFVKNNHTVLDGLLKYYKNGGFSHTMEGSVNQMATEQAMYGLVAYYRSICNKNRLYDMRDGITYKELKHVDKDIHISKESIKNIKPKKRKKNNKINSSKKSQTRDVSRTKTYQDKSYSVLKKADKWGIKKSKKKALKEKISSVNQTIKTENAKKETLTEKKADEKKKTANKRATSKSSVIYIILGCGALVLLGVVVVGLVLYKKKNEKMD